MREQVAAGPRRLFDGPRDRLVFVTGAIGVGGAMVTTSTSLFLADGIGATPLMIGLFFAGRGVAEIFTDLAVAVLSDRFGQRRTLLALVSVMSALGALGYAVIRDYTALLIVGAVCFGIGGASFSQLFAYTREFAESRSYNVNNVNALLRSVTSASWIIGPPAAFLLIAHTGFAQLYLLAAALYGVAGVVCRWGLPHLPVERPAPGSKVRMFAGLDGRMAALLIAVAILLTTNQMYNINIALMVTKDLGLPAQLPGWLAGTCSLLEVGILVAIGRWGDRIGKAHLLLAAAACAVVFFLLLPIATTVVALLALQLLNAFWCAVLLSVPVVLVGDAMPGRLGVASSLYAVAFKAGIILGGAVDGLVAALVGFTSLFFVCAALSAVAVALLLAGTRRRVPEGDT